VLGARLDEDLAALVEVGERGVGLEVEVLLPAELELAGELECRPRQTRFRVTAGQRPGVALEAPGLDRLGQGEQGRQRLVVHLHGRGSQSSGVLGLPEHPADGVAVEHHLRWEQRLVVLDAGVVHAGHVGGGEHPDDAGDRAGRLGPQRADPGVGVRGLHRPGVQHTGHPDDEVVGVERGPGDVQRRTLVRDLHADLGRRRSLGQRTHRVTSWLSGPAVSA
jgi:hypothetical protein